jgi:hypothetical protein
MASFNGAPWSVNSSASGANASSASKTAGAAGVQHVADRIFIGLATGATVSTALLVHLRDGATGAGTVLCSWAMSSGLVTALSGVNSQNYDSGPASLGFVGTAATSMTAEFAAAGPANSVNCVSLQGHDIS